MPRSRLVALALIALAACSSGGPGASPSKSPSPSKAATTKPPAAPPAPPKVVVERDRTLFVLEGGKARRISAQGFYPGGRRPGEPPVAVSPNGRWLLAYTAVRPGWFALPIAGGAPIRLPSPAKIPVWSRFSTIAYVADGDLHLLVPGGRDTTLLAPAPEGCCFALAWSPDGTLIAMEGFDRTIGREQIWTVGRTGKGLRRVWAGAAGSDDTTAWALGFSPDSERIVTGNAERPLTVDLEGRSRELDGAPVLRANGYTWSRGRILVLTHSDPERLAWEDAAAGGASIFEEPVAFATEAALNPAGSLLGVTLVRREDSKTALFVVRPDGTGLRRLTDWGEAVSLGGWSRDGRWLVYELTRSRTVRAALVAGGTVRTLGAGRLRAVL